MSMKWRKILKKLFYKIVRFFILLLLLAVLAIFALLAVKQFVPQSAAILPFNNELTNFEIQTRKQADTIVKTVQATYFDLQKNFKTQIDNMNVQTNKFFNGLK